ARLKELGYDLTPEEIESAFVKLKHLADQKKHIFDEDIETLVSEEVSKTPEIYQLAGLSVSSGMKKEPKAAIMMKVKGKVVRKTATGDGPVDATYKAIASITKTKSKLLKFEVKGITGGTDALGEVMVSLKENGKTVRGNGADTDIIVAAAKAYINALNKLVMRKK
ncbi:MAG: alpha-isopropylmalate synthase regulatory domain-containing protein, partial [Thermodesulfovibrionales bacterium]|nr:alpha-isopropylmalate synthase regulatory domain-containing protein [Thermodesulfovibrionales bacterium]